MTAVRRRRPINRALSLICVCGVFQNLATKFVHFRPSAAVVIGMVCSCSSTCGRLSLHVQDTPTFKVLVLGAVMSGKVCWRRFLLLLMSESSKL